MVPDHQRAWLPDYSAKLRKNRRIGKSDSAFLNRLPQVPRVFPKLARVSLSWREFICFFPKKLT